MAQKNYYYDKETCTYKEEVITPKKITKKVLEYLSMGVIIGGVFFGASYSFLDDIKQKNLKEKNNQLVAQIEKVNAKLVNLEASVEDIHNRDNNFYRSILNTSPIDNGVWNGGTGGAVTPILAMQPTALRDAEAKLNNLTYKIELQNRSFEHLSKLLKENQEKLKRIPAIKPVPGVVISGFGVRVHPILHIRKEHTGLDFTAPIGTPVMATADGVVATATAGNGYGNQIEIDHGYGFVTKFAHLSEFKVKVGDVVKRGDLIALTGNTGLSSGPHLHYEIIKNGEKIDPVDYFYQDLSPKEYEQFRKEAAAASQTMD